MVKNLQLECMSPGYTIQLQVHSYLFSLDNPFFEFWSSPILSYFNFTLFLDQLNSWKDRENPNGSSSS